MRSRQHGQVMLLAVAVLLVLLAAALILFDFHNVLRAKIKVESAEQAAALAGSQWQVIGLNMIGEINLLKATTLMLEEAETVPTPAFVPPNAELTPAQLEKQKKLHRLASRLRTLDETQTRISFIVPLLGYMAVQQTAKQNGMSGDNGLVQYYYSETLPLNDYRDRDIQGYLWFEPYRRLVGEVAAQRCPVRCNSRISEIPSEWSNAQGSLKIDGGGSTSFALLLSEEELYDAIAHRNYCYWQLLKMAKQGVYLSDPWWKIEYIPGRFIGESELLSLGVDFSGGANVPELLETGRLDGLSVSAPWNTDLEFQPDSWCTYDSKWYGVEGDESFDAHQAYWVGGGWLRNDRKPGFLYEGAVCAVDGSVTTSRSLMFRMKPQSGKRVKISEPAAARNSASTIAVGHVPSGNRGTNLGVVAKVLGGFHDLRGEDDVPTATEVILPVFSRGLLIPSSMPYHVSMLTKGDNALKRFLQWLATHPDIDRDEPPPGTSWYLAQLRELMDPDFILGIYNLRFPGVDTLSPQEIFGRQYFFPLRADGAGWLQRAYLARVNACPTRVVYTGKILSDGSPEIQLEPAVPDNVPTELPQTYVDDRGETRRYYEDYADVTRVYYGTEKTGYHYYLKQNGKIRTNEDISCRGRLWHGRGGSMHQGTESGPPRL